MHRRRPEDDRPADQARSEDKRWPEAHVSLSHVNTVGPCTTRLKRCRKRLVSIVKICL